VIYAWRDLLDEFKKQHGTETKIMMTEAYANLTFTMRYYESDDGTRKGSHIPFNFLMIGELNGDSTAQDFAHTVSKWMNFMPAGFTANWVVSKMLRSTILFHSQIASQLGNHDNSRVGSRYGAERIDALNAMLLTLPGAGVTYNVRNSFLFIYSSKIYKIKKKEEIGILRVLSWRDSISN
jgi:alpha-glucosidase